MRPNIQLQSIGSDLPSSHTLDTGVLHMYEPVVTNPHVFFSRTHYHLCQMQKLIKICSELPPLD